MAKDAGRVKARRLAEVPEFCHGLALLEPLASKRKRLPAASRGRRSDAQRAVGVTLSDER